MPTFFGRAMLAAESSHSVDTAHAHWIGEYTPIRSENIIVDGPTFAFMRHIGGNEWTQPTMRGHFCSIL